LAFANVQSVKIIGQGWSMGKTILVGALIGAGVLLLNAIIVVAAGWIGATILMFAAIVPNSPTKTLVAGLIAASMNPLGMLIAKARGTWDFGPASNVLVMHYPDYLLVSVSVVISHVVTKLGQHVTKAREMGSYRLDTLLGKVESERYGGLVTACWLATRQSS